MFISLAVVWILGLLCLCAGFKSYVKQDLDKIMDSYGLDQIAK